jgi:AcrR family transcriptional regulator
MLDYLPLIGGDVVTAARRERQRREIRQGILDAARAIAARDGWQAVTVRRLAEQVEYSPPIIYQHFANKEAVLLELVREGFRQLRTALDAASENTDAPEDALLRMARAYWAFAWDAPDLYQVMYGLGGVPFGVAATWEDGNRIGEAVAPVVAAISGASGPPNPEEVETRVLGLWAAMHGLVALAMAGRIAGGREGGTPLVDQIVRDAITAWSA